MEIVNIEKQATVGQITPQGAGYCFISCGLICIITELVATYLGLVFTSF